MYLLCERGIRLSFLQLWGLVLGNDNAVITVYLSVLVNLFLTIIRRYYLQYFCVTVSVLNVYCTENFVLCCSEVAN